MKTLRLNRNANWYTARFTDITVLGSTVVLENYFSGEKYIIADKKFAMKISMYLFRDEKNGEFHWFENGVEKWVNNRKSNKYDNVENR